MTAPEVALIKAAMNLGGVFVILFLFAFMFYRLCLKAGPAAVRFAAEFIDAQQRQAQAMTDVKDVIRDYVTADNNEHREILIGIQVLASETKDIKHMLERKPNDED